MSALAGTRVALIHLVALLTACAGAATPAATAPRPPSLVWQPWGEAAFASARADGRLVLVDAGIEGCTACAWQHDRVYTDPAVRELLRDHFVLVTVDADRQPDLGARFEPWGWPATVILDADGHVLRRVRGFVGVPRFRAALAEITRTPEPEPQAATGTTSASTCAVAAAELDRRRDASGWGSFVLDSPVMLAWLLSASGDAERWTDAEHAAELDERLIDPVWGGVFVGMRPDAPSTPVWERRLLHETAALSSFAALFAATRDGRWSRDAWEVSRYLTDVLREPDGLYASTQRDAPPGMEGADYYALDDAGRRRVGAPHIDHATYTDQNARLASAYALLFRATGDERAIVAARAIVDRVLSERTRDDGGVAQSGPAPHDERLRPALADDRLFLRAQGPWGLALLALEEITSEPRYLAAAQRVALAAQPLLRPDGQLAAAWPEAAGPGGAAATGAGEVAELARFLARLGARMHDEAMTERARAVLGSISTTAVVSAGTPALGTYLLAQAELALGFVDVTLVEGPASSSLYDAALHAAGPRVLVHREPAAPIGRYPDAGSAYVCSDVACSSPITDPERLRAAIAAAARVEPPLQICPP